MDNQDVSTISPPQPPPGFLPLPIANAATSQSSAPQPPQGFVPMAPQPPQIDMQESLAGNLYDKASRAASSVADVTGLTAAAQSAQQAQAEDAAVRNAVTDHIKNGEYMDAAKLGLAHLNARAKQSVLESPPVAAIKAQVGEVGKSFDPKLSPVEQIAHAGASLIPLAGPFAASVAEKAGTQIGQRDYAGAVGTGVGAIAPALLTGGESEAEATPKAVETPKAPAVAQTAPMDAGAAYLSRLRESLKDESGEATIPGTGSSKADTTPAKPVAKPAPEAQAETPAEKPTVATWYSKAARVIADKVPNSASGDSILATLRNAGVKENEIDWTGLDEYLKGKPKVSKADVTQYLSDNAIKLEETDKSDTPTKAKELAIQREKAYVEQNRLFEDLKYSDARGETPFSVANWLRSDEDTKTTALSNVTPEVAVKFRRLDELGKTMTDLDKQITDAKNPQPSAEIRAKHKDELDAINEAKTKVRSELDKIDNAGYGENRMHYSELLAKHSNLMDMQDKLQDQMVRETHGVSDSGPTKFGQWVLPGEKTNYGEQLMRLPVSESLDRIALNQARQNYNQFTRRLRDRLGDLGANPFHENHPETGRMTPEERNEFGNLDHTLTKLRDGEKPEQDLNFYHKAHFEEPNILAHIRHTDRVDAAGKKVLLLEEIQSDWHQQGKREGYNTPNNPRLSPKDAAKELDVANDLHRSASERWSKREQLGISDEQAKTELHAATQRMNAATTAYNRVHNGISGVPDAPFKADWHELAVKRMLRHAAENGYDKMAWTTGKQQAERYDLSKQISQVEYYPETKTLEAYDHAGKRVVSQTDVERKDIADHIGKDAAAKLDKQISEYPQFSEKDYPVDFDDEIGKFVAHDPNGDLVRDSGGDVISSSSQSEVEREIEYMIEHERNQVPTPRISGLDLKVGGEWAKALYDRAIPNFLNKYAKKWRAKVGETSISNHVAVINKAGKEVWAGERKDLPQLDNGETVYDPGKVHSIDITPAMKKSVLQEGQPISENKIPSWKSAVMPLAA